MTEDRVEVPKDTLLRLHHGADAKSVQENFDQYFTDVSALEISMMGHELMGTDAGVTFENIISSYNVHANLFKSVISDVDMPGVKQERHPVYISKQENLALRAVILRIHRIIENYEKAENEEFRPNLAHGLKHQMSLLGQFQNHYNRKENLSFPVMERHGHDTSSKVMWGADDSIRTFLKKAQTAVGQLPDLIIGETSSAFEMFAEESREIVFKEEVILLMISLETLVQDDWLVTAGESDAYGYTIVKPAAK